MVDIAPVRVRLNELANWVGHRCELQPTQKLLSNAASETIILGDDGWAEIQVSVKMHRRAPPPYCGIRGLDRIETIGGQPLPDAGH